MSQADADSYDEIPYLSQVFAHTHPDRLATMATLLGMKPAPVDRCRVLELGSGTGANLIPMAHDLPGSQFIGIDLSPKQVAMGQERAAALGLTNLDLRALSILDVGEDFGDFDYIICHGVYSWVPAEVRVKILEVCGRRLKPDGVAYVSYNTYPGWHIRGMVREMMAYHVRQFADPFERIRQARALIEFLAGAVGSRDTLYGSLLSVEADQLDNSPDPYVYHEFLERVNEPVYFYQFIERAAAQGLQYVAEARFSKLARSLNAQVKATLETLATDLISGEQYLDFVRNRAFRQSLLCHQGVRLERPLSPARVPALKANALARPKEADPDVASAAVVEFQSRDGIQLSTNNPLIKAALVHLDDVFPQALSFADLHAAVSERLAGVPDLDPPGGGREALADVLLQCFLSNAVELRTFLPPVAAWPTERPVASRLARELAKSDSRVVNRHHQRADLSPLESLTLQALDGTRDRSALLERLVEHAADGTLGINRAGQPVTDPPAVREALAAATEPCLVKLAKLGLLIG